MRRRSGGRDERQRPGAGSAVRRRLAPLVRAVAAATVLALALGGCAQASDRPVGPRFVTPPLIRYSSVLWPVPLELVGAVPGSRLRIASALDTDRGSWRSSATYTVPASGVLDLAAARPQLAPFREPDSVGLFWSLAGPELVGPALAAQWMRETLPVRLTAFDGDRVVATRSFALQGLADGLRPYTLYTRDLAGPSAGRLPRETHEDQPVARYWNATSPERPITPAVLMFDDPSPGASSAFAAPLLARFGASVLVLPLTSARDGVRASGVIDSTTVEGALDWLAEQPSVDGRAIFAYGTGVAEPLALWAARRFPNRIHGLFAAGGAPELLCLPSGSTAPAFERGAGLPCRVAPEPVSPSSVIPLDAVDGPVVLACGARDAVLASACAGQAALAGTRGVRAGDAILRAAEAGHEVTVPPGLPIALPRSAQAQATERARIAFWNAVGQIVLRAARS